MNWPEAFVTAVAIVGVCSCVMAFALRRSLAENEPPCEEQKKLPGLRAPGEYYRKYRVSYTPARRPRRNAKQHTTT